MLSPDNVLLEDDCEDYVEDKRTVIMKGKKALSRLVRWFDRAFSRGWGRQVVFLGGLLLVVLGVWIFIVWLCNYGQFSTKSLVRIVELILDPGSFQGSEAFVDQSKGGVPVVIQLLITLSGAVVFTAMMITVIGNIVNNRIEDFKKGRVRYDFDDHILVLGANAMLSNMIKEFIRTNEHESRKIVVLTTQDTEKLHDKMLSSNPGFDDVIDITWLNGSRTVEETLRNVQVSEAHSIYILGEDDETDHDSINLITWNLVRELCKDVQSEMECYLVVDRISTYHIFPFGEKMTDTHLHLNIINPLESWAQRVLVSREYETGKKKEFFPPIDGEDGIRADSRETVRFVIFGMTQMSYVMATTVAHIAHFPNFLNDPSKKTKICFVAPDIREEMNFFLGHYDNLFRLSYAKYISWKAGEKRIEQIRTPEERFGDFLDVEWEFIDSSIETEEIRTQIGQWINEDTEKLSLAICMNDPRANLAAALYLPDSIYQHRIPVFAYQPQSGEVLRYAHNTDRYSNVYPFGMKEESYDPLFNRRVAKAKRINYLYHLQNNQQQYTGMGSTSELDKYWNMNNQYVYRFSNLYATVSIPTKLRSVGLKQESLSGDEGLTDAQIMTLAKLEHNRWNMERLLLGFSPVEKDEREEINRMLVENPSEGKARKKALQAKYFHKDIAPYEELPDSSKEYDTAIVSNILDVVK